MISIIILVQPFIIFLLLFINYSIVLCIFDKVISYLFCISLLITTIYLFFILIIYLFNSDDGGHFCYFQSNHLWQLVCIVDHLFIINTIVFLIVVR